MIKFFKSVSRDLIQIRLHLLFYSKNNEMIKCAIELNLHLKNEFLIPLIAKKVKSN